MFGKNREIPLTFFSCHVEINLGQSIILRAGPARGSGSRSNPVYVPKLGVATAEEAPARCARRSGCAVSGGSGPVSRFARRHHRFL